MIVDSEYHEQRYCDPGWVTIFAGGILSSTSDNTLIEYFSSFGEVRNFRRMYNKEQRESGYAFFEALPETTKRISSRPHLIGNGLVNCKVAASEDNINEVQRDEMERKLFVSNLPMNTSDVELYNLFAPLAPLTKAYMVRHRADGSTKNFGFVIFQKTHDLKKVLESSCQIRLRGKKVCMEQAQDRQSQRAIRRGGQQTSSHGPLESSCKSSILQQSYLLNQSSNNYRFNRSSNSLIQFGHQHIFQMAKRSTPTTQSPLSVCRKMDQSKISYLNCTMKYWQQ